MPKHWRPIIETIAECTMPSICSLEILIWVVKTKRCEPKCTKWGGSPCQHVTLGGIELESKSPSKQLMLCKRSFTSCFMSGRAEMNRCWGIVIAVTFSITFSCSLKLQHCGFWLHFRGKKSNGNDTSSQQIGSLFSFRLLFYMYYSYTFMGC